jgi:hypothetical protein
MASGTNVSVEPIGKALEQHYGRKLLATGGTA